MSSIETIPGRPVRRLQSVGSVLIKLQKQLRLWRRRHRTRLHLLELNDHQLQDLGLTRAAARAEAMRPFWESNAPYKDWF
ncbi:MULTISPECIES: DUF1127 domain-containing protein [unclassified Roseibium]|uniref:DUF1127 domain-containing protein n=1 Tax=unclassified Roseibium TaxID=2629323 RepID=UPI00317BFE4A